MTNFNRSLFQFVHHFAGMNSFLNGIGIFFADYLSYILVLGFLFLVYEQKGWRSKVYLFCEGSLAVILARGLLKPIIDLFYQEGRPFSFYNFTPLISESGWAFPSGHALFFFALATVLWFVNRKWGTWYFILAILMGIARVFVGVHWPLDIVGGALLGIASAYFVHWLLRDSRNKLTGKL